VEDDIVGDSKLLEKPEDALGLGVLAMLDLQWEIEGVMNIEVVKSDGLVVALFLVCRHPNSSK
jgi:hypothetical protein